MNDRSDPGDAVTPRLYRVILPVRSIEAAAEFYSGLFEMSGERVSPGRHYFDLGGTILFRHTTRFPEGHSAHSL